MFNAMIQSLKQKKRKLVFPEGPDPRILEAASRLHKEEILEPILVGSREEIEASAGKRGISIDGIEIIDPLNFPEMDKMVQTMYEIRKGKMSLEECAAALQKSNYFGTMLVKMGYAYGLLGGATYSTADTVRPALQIIKTKPGNKSVSSSFILNRPKAGGGNEIYAFGDCGIIINPSEDDLVEITIETARTARVFGLDPVVALLSFSTKGSASDATVDKMVNATKKLQSMNLDFPVDGEFQFDAAFSAEVGQRKAPGSVVPGRANTFIFPDINAGNIGYKIAQRLGGFEAYGPILQGLNAPINDLSRGCNAEEVYKMAILTAAYE
jgi:phosphate acetyltransferase